MYNFPANHRDSANNRLFGKLYKIYCYAVPMVRGKRHWLYCTYNIISEKVSRLASFVSGKIHMTTVVDVFRERNKQFLVYFWAIEKIHFFVENNNIFNWNVRETKRYAIFKYSYLLPVKGKQSILIYNSKTIPNTYIQISDNFSSI